jgi:hypothetical protein
MDKMWESGKSALRGIGLGWRSGVPCGLHVKNEDKSAYPGIWFANPGSSSISIE